MTADSRSKLAARYGTEEVSPLTQCNAVIEQLLDHRSIGRRYLDGGCRLVCPRCSLSTEGTRLCLKSQETEMWPRNSLGSVQSPTINGKEFCDGKAL